MHISSNCVKYLINLYEEQNIFVEVLFDNEISKKFWIKNKFFPYQQKFKFSKIVKLALAYKCVIMQPTYLPWE